MKRRMSTFEDFIGIWDRVLGHTPMPRVQKALPQPSRPQRFARYKLTEAWFLEQKATQDHLCAICDRSASEFRINDLVIDHCHYSGVVRGLLCPPCNQGLGAFLDCPDLMEVAIAYLKRGDK